jgi:hypothetical protein
VHDSGADLHEERVHRVYVGALARSEAYIVQSDAPLDEPTVPVLLVGRRDGEARACLQKRLGGSQMERRP